MAALRRSPNPLRRLHQLNGPNGVNPVWAPGGQINFKFEDVPNTLVALGRKHINYTAAVRFKFKGNLTSTLGVIIPRNVFTPMLIASVQCQGTELGTPVSSTHMLGGIIDTNSFIRSGGEINLFNPSTISLAAATPKEFEYVVDIWLANMSQSRGHHTAPLSLFLRPGEIFINTPSSLAAVDPSLADVSISGMTVTAHAVLLPDTEIRVCPTWQMTRHKANAGAGTDSIMINSFGANSTLTGVQGKAGIHSILWASQNIIGDAKGPGTVASLTQFACDFLGIRQNNDPVAFVQQLFAEVGPDSWTDSLGNLLNLAFPMFDLNAAPNVSIMDTARFFPVIPPVKHFDATKLLDGVGNPSYDLTGTFTPGANHYTYVEGAYPQTQDKLDALLEVIKRSNIGAELYGNNDLEYSTKLKNKQNPMDIAAFNPEKFTYLPRKVAPKASTPAITVAVK